MAVSIVLRTNWTERGSRERPEGVVKKDRSKLAAVAIAGIFSPAIY